MPNQLDEIVDFRQILFKIIGNWFLLVVSLCCAFIIAFAYNRYSVELFSAETSVLIKEEHSLPTASDLLYEKKNFKQKSLENKSLELKSYLLVHQTLEDLRFDISYFIEGNIKITET